MASVYDLKPKFQTLLRPVCARLVRLGATPNGVTLFALLLSVVGGTCIGVWGSERLVLLVLPVVLFVRMALNAIDGMIAREHDMKSHLGAVLNELGDVVSDAALYLPLALVPGFDPFAMVSLVVLAGLTETAGILSARLGGSRRYDGPMGKSDRAFVFGALGLALGVGASAGVWLTVLLWAVVALCALTVVRRSARGLRELKAGDA